MAAQGAQRLRTDARTLWRRAAAGLFDRDHTAYLPEDLQHRVVWVVPEDALADGWRVDDDDEQDVSRDVDIRLRTEEVMTQAAGLARLGDGHTHGGSFIWVVYAGDTSYALPAREGAEVVQLHAVSCTELRPTKWEADPTSDRFGQPVSYQLTMQRGGMVFAGVEVHASRLVYMPGLRRARTREETDSEAGRDWSALRIYREAIQGLDQGWRSSGRLLERRAIPAVEFADALGSRGADGDASGLKEAIAMFRDTFNVDKLAVMLGGSKLSWLAPAVSGTSELLATMGWRMASVEGIPLTKLFGQPPGGLSTDDASATATYNALLNRTRRKVYTGVLLDLYARILGPNVARRIEWPALDEPTDKERAETSLIRAQRDVALVTAGIWTERESRARYADGEEVDLPILDDAEWEGEMLAADERAAEMAAQMAPQIAPPEGDDEPDDVTEEPEPEEPEDDAPDAPA